MNWCAVEAAVGVTSTIETSPLAASCAETFILIVHHLLKRETRSAPVDGAVVDKYREVITAHSTHNTHHIRHQTILLHRKPAVSLVTMMRMVTWHHYSAGHKQFWAHSLHSLLNFYLASFWHSKNWGNSSLSLSLSLSLSAPWGKQHHTVE